MSNKKLTPAEIKELVKDKEKIVKAKQIVKK